MRRAVLAALVGLVVLVPGVEAKPLSTHQARVALDRDLARDQDSLRIDSYRLGRCHRVSRRAIDCNAWVGELPAYGDSGYDEGWMIYRMKLRGHRVKVRFLDFIWA